jgi:hypothetical protein
MRRKVSVANLDVKSRCFIVPMVSLRISLLRLVSVHFSLQYRIADVQQAALYFIGGVRVTFSTGIAAGGNLAYWLLSISLLMPVSDSYIYRTSYVITVFFTLISASVIAEACSASPSAGSIYLWAAESGGPRFGRLFGFVVAWWSTTAWTTFCASNSQAAANYMLSVGRQRSAHNQYLD